MLLAESGFERENVSVATVEDSPSARERLARFLTLEHPTLPAVLDLDVSGSSLSLRSRERKGAPAARARHSRETAAALFVQAASALLFLASRGFPLEPADFEEARVEIWNGAPHLWLA